MKRGRPRKIELEPESRTIGVRMSVPMWKEVRAMADADDRPIGVIARRLMQSALDSLKSKP
jgi:hypothetical protein